MRPALPDRVLADVDGGVRPGALGDVFDDLGDAGLPLDQEHVAGPDVLLEVLEVVRNAALVAPHLPGEEADQGVGKGPLEAHEASSARAGTIASCYHRRRCGELALVILGTLAVAAPAAAHPAPFSYVDVYLGEQAVDVTVVAHVYDLAHDLEMDDPEDLLDSGVVAKRAEALAALLSSRFEIAADGARPLLPDVGRTFRLSGPAVGPRSGSPAPIARAAGVVRVRAVLFPYDPKHQTFLNVYDQGALQAQAILDREHLRSSTSPGSRQGVLAVVRRFVPAGVHHILIGPDHLLFLVGLLLLGGSLRQLALVVTAFTLAHSVTLSLAVLGLVNAPSRLVEPAIALSIVYVGIDNLIVRSGRDLRRGSRSASASSTASASRACCARWSCRDARSAGPCSRSTSASRSASWPSWSSSLSALAALRARSEWAGRRLAVVGSVAVVAAGRCGSCNGCCSRRLGGTAASKEKRHDSRNRPGHPDGGRAGSSLAVSAYQAPPAASPTPGPKVVEVEKIKDNLFMLKGGGGQHRRVRGHERRRGRGHEAAGLGPAHPRQDQGADAQAGHHDHQHAHPRRPRQRQRRVPGHRGHRHPREHQGEHGQDGRRPPAFPPSAAGPNMFTASGGKGHAEADVQGHDDAGQGRGPGRPLLLRPRAHERRRVRGLPRPARDARGRHLRAQGPAAPGREQRGQRRRSSATRWPRRPPASRAWTRSSPATARS